MIDIEIDGKSLQTEPGSMIIEAADRAGIYIPRYCYHEKLSIAANCRMCLVEVEKAPKPLPACATPVTAGMKVYTCSAKAKDAQRSVMEFLLINHPLDCPICDQGGQCELQDLSMGYGRSFSRFEEGKRAVKDDDLGPLVETFMTRCIQCTRCVRFGTEIAGLRELGAVGRGENMQISTYIKHSMESELSGNIIDLCPVGALTAKPSRFQARPWELQQNQSIAPHDCVGSNIYIHTRRQEVIKVVPHKNEALNETWISDRDRFSYAALCSPDRLQKPMIKVGEEWQETDWTTAFDFVVNGLKSVITKHSAQQMAALVSPSATTEEFYLLQKLLRGLGCNNIDHRMHQTDFADQEHRALYPGLSIKIADIEIQNTILLIGSDIQREQPILGHRVRKAALRGAHVLSINATDYPFNFEQKQRIICTPNDMVKVLAGVAKILIAKNTMAVPTTFTQLLEPVQPDKEVMALAEYLANSEKILLLLGALAHNHPEAATIRTLAQLIANATNATIGYLTEGANSAGAWLAGAIPHRGAAGASLPVAGLAANQALAAHLKAYILLNIEPELDCTDSAQAINAMNQAEFVVACSPFKSDFYLEHVDAILPIAAFSETDGTFVNAEGSWQTFSAAVPPPGEVRPAWKVLRVLANQFAVEGFDYNSAEQIRDELEQQVAMADVQVQTWMPMELKISQSATLTRITEWPIYAIDNLVRRAVPLQQSATNYPVAIYIHPELARQHHLQESMQATVVQGNVYAKLSVTLDPRMPKGCIGIPAGCPETASLGAAFGAIEIHV